MLKKSQSRSSSVQWSMTQQQLMEDIVWTIMKLWSAEVPDVARDIVKKNNNPCHLENAQFKKKTYECWV